MNLKAVSMMTITGLKKKQIQLDFIRSSKKYIKFHIISSLNDKDKIIYTMTLSIVCMFLKYNSNKLGTHA